MITVGTRTRKEAIKFFERITGVPIVMKNEVKQCAVMPAEHAPKSLTEIDWSEQ